MISMTDQHMETDSRGLEQFLFLHDIRFYTTRKSPLGRTLWVYHRTKDLVRVVNEWEDIIVKRNASGRKQYEL